ncbi:hypothetical protein ACFOLG_01845 [Vogesella facilis]|uniref:Uncharacterized protein n=1 Tax=Vogesella facilis TaxID=1655232 RepID=A0ABV7RBZ6_9NEIS
MASIDIFSLPQDKWTKWKYEKSPFAHFSLNADQEGLDLLVGRDELLQKQVIPSFSTWGKISSLNGGVGVGKTSLANVAAFILEELANKARNNKTSNRHIYSCFENIKYEKSHTDEDFEFSIFLAIAKKIYSIKDGNSDFSWAVLPYYEEYRHCINDPTFKDGGLSIAAIGGFDKSKSLNTHPAHGKTAFIGTIKSWLDTLFPQRNSFIICVIDNFELMDEAEKLIEFFEKKRDTLLNQKGLKFVLCGANNSVLKLNTAWLKAFIDNTIEVPSINIANAAKIYETRTEKFAKPSSYIPINETEFIDLANLIKVNTRDLLGEAENFCQYIDLKSIAGEPLPKSAIDKSQKYKEWIILQTNEALKAIGKRITKNCWRILNIASTPTMDGTFKSGDYELFNIPQGSYSNVINTLKDLKLVEERNDEEHKKKRIYTLTPKAYYILHASKNGDVNQFDALEDTTPPE